MVLYNVPSLKLWVYHKVMSLRFGGDTEKLIMLMFEHYLVS